MPQKKNFSLAEKHVKSAKRVIDPLIKLSIHKRRAFLPFESLIYLK